MTERNNKWHTVLVAVRVVAMAVATLAAALMGDELLQDGAARAVLAEALGRPGSLFRSSEIPEVRLLRPLQWE